MDPRNLSPRVPDFEPVKTVDTPDPYTVRVTTSELFQPGLRELGHGDPARAPPEPRAARRRGARAPARTRPTFSVRDAGFNRRPVGTRRRSASPSGRPTSLIRLVRNDDYWEGAAELPRVPDPDHPGPPDRRSSPSTPARRTATRPSPTRWRGSRTIRASTLNSRARASGYTLHRLQHAAPGLPGRAGPDRARHGDRRRRDHPLRPLRPGRADHRPVSRSRPTYYDPDVKPAALRSGRAPRGSSPRPAGARTPQGILEKDGKPLAFTLITNSGNEERQAIMVIAQNAWRRLGVKVEILALEWAVFIHERVEQARLRRGRPRLGDGPRRRTSTRSSTRARPGRSQLNFVGYANPRADELMVRIRREYDDARQTAMARELHRLIAQDQPYTFLYVRRVLALLDGEDRPHGAPGRTGRPQYLPFEPNRLGRIRFHFNEWIKTPRAGPAALPARAERRAEADAARSCCGPAGGSSGRSSSSRSSPSPVVHLAPGAPEPDRPPEPALHQGAARSATGRPSTSTSRSTSSTGSSTSGCSPASSARSRTTSRSCRRSSSGRGTASRSSWSGRSWSGASPSRSGSRPRSGATPGSTA